MSISGYYGRPNKKHPLKIEPNDPIFIIVPYWIHQAIVRNRMTLDDIRRYHEIRRIISLEEAIHLYWIQYPFSADSDSSLDDKNSLDLRRLFLGGSLIGGLDLWNDETDSLDKTERQQYIYSYSNTDLINQYLVERLSYNNDEVDPTTKIGEDKPTPLYRFVLGENNQIYAIVEKGIIDWLRDQENALTYLRDGMNLLYSLIPVYQVYSKPIAGKYIENLPLIN